MRLRLALALLVLAAIAAAWALVTWLSHGFVFTLLGARVTSFNVMRPLFIAGAAAMAAIVAAGPSGLRPLAFDLRRRVTVARTAATLACFTAVVGLLFNSWTASGPDSFAYVSQAALWRTGHLEAPAAIAARAPWPNAVTTFAPFGYRAAPNGAPAMVPVTAPGVPMLMAALQLVFGHAAAFVITPISGGMLVWLTFAIGRRVRSAVTGLAAAWLVATSPAFLFMLMWPMTDIPAAACAALMLALLLRAPTPAAAFGAGVAAALGILTRPNFVLIAASAGLWILIDAAWRGRRDAPVVAGTWWRRALAFAIGAAPALIITLVLNARWYGSPFASGYGAAGELTSLTLLPRNASLYAQWLLATSPLAFVGLAALCWPSARLWGEHATSAAWLLVLSTVAACSVYLVYGRFVDWWYLRFLLPAWPALFVATGVVADALRTRGRWLAAGVLLVVVAAGVIGVRLAEARGIFGLGRGERRYVSVATVVAQATEPDAVIITWQHAGTIRYYGGRETLRWDWLDPAWLDRTVAWLAAQGRHPYILLEDWEQPQFEAQFGPANDLGRLTFAPAMAWQSPRFPGWVWLYDPMNRSVTTSRPGPEVEATQPFAAPAAAEPWRGLY
jgi:hypothetical protein